MSSSHDGTTRPARPGRAARAAAPRKCAGEDVQAQIGIQLRTVYEKLLAEPVPDRFLKLLEELDRSSAAPDPTDPET